MKKLFALFAVAALAAVGCDDKGKSSGSGTKTQTHTTTVLHTATERATLADVTVRKDVTNTVKETVRVPGGTTTSKGPELKDKDGK